MKRSTWKDRSDLMGSVLVLVALLAVILIVVKVTAFFLASARAAGTVTQAVQRGRPDAAHRRAQSDRRLGVAEALKKNNLFAPPAPRANPIEAVTGIFGDEALINGRWYGVGAKVGDARIVRIGPASVTTEWNGKRTTLHPIDHASTESKTPSKPSERTDSGSRRARPSGDAREVVVIGRPQPRRPDTRPSGPPSVTRDTFAQIGAGLGMKLSPQVQDGMIRYWRGLSAEQQAQARVRWDRMSDNERRSVLRGFQGRGR